MTERRSLGFDPWGQVEEFVEFDGDDTARVVFKGDNTAQLDANQQMRNDGSNGYSPSKDLRKIAEIDAASALMLASMWGVRPLSAEFDEKFMALLQSGDFQNLKTVDGGIPKAMVKPKWQ